MAIPNNPVPLGLITVTAAGTPVPLIQNFTTDYASLVSNKIEIQASPSNTGLIYIGYAGMVKATGVKVLRVLNSGETWSITDPSAADVFDVYKFYIDSDVNSEGVYASAHVR